MFNRFILDAEQLEKVMTDREALALWNRMQQALNANGQLFVWDDLRFPVQNLRLPSSNPAVYEVVTIDGVGWELLTFAAGVDRQVMFNCQLPHGWFEGTDLKFHVHWMPETTNAGNIIWELQYMWENVNGVFSTTVLITSTTAAPGVINQHTIAGVDDLLATDRKISSMIIGCLTRRGASGDDTFTGKARLLEADFHIKWDTTGSKKLFTK